MENKSRLVFADAVQIEDFAGVIDRKNGICYN